MDPELLITAVEKIPALYDKTDRHYSNRNYVTAAWKKVSEEVGCTARKRWTKLRDYFRKTHKEVTSRKSGSAGGKKKRWYLYDNMLFVLPHLVDRKTQSNLSSSEDEEIPDLKEGSQASSSSCVLSNSPTPTSHVNSLAPLAAGSQEKSHAQTYTKPRPQNQNQSSSRRPKYMYPQEPQEVSFDAEMIQAIKGLSQNQESMNNDDDLLFLRSLAPKMKLLNPVDKMECQYEMHTLVMRYLRKSRQTAQSSSPHTTGN